MPAWLMNAYLIHVWTVVWASQVNDTVLLLSPAESGVTGESGQGQLAEGKVSLSSCLGSASNLILGNSPEF